MTSTYCDQKSSLGGYIKDCPPWQSGLNLICKKEYTILDFQLLDESSELEMSEHLSDIEDLDVTECITRNTNHNQKVEVEADENWLSQQYLANKPSKIVLRIRKNGKNEICPVSKIKREDSCIMPPDLFDQT